MTEESAISARRRKLVSILLGVGTLLLFLLLAGLNAFNVRLLNPSTTGRILVFTGLSVIAFLLFVAVLLLLVRNVLKLYADERSRVLGSRLRTRMLAGAVLVSLVPIGSMFAFSYGLMNRAVDRWFSEPANEVRDSSNRMALDLAQYSTANARVEAEAIAANLMLPSAAAAPVSARRPEISGGRGEHRPAEPRPSATERSTRQSSHARPELRSRLPSPRSGALPARAGADAFRPAAPSREALLRVFREHEITLQNGFALAFREGRPMAAFHVPTGGANTARLKLWLPGDAGETEDDARPVSAMGERSGALGAGRGETPDVIAGPISSSILSAADRSDGPMFSLDGVDYALGTAALPTGGTVVVGLPLPPGISTNMARLRSAADTYRVLYSSRREVRWLYTLLLLLMTSLALFASSWLALHLSKQVTRPVEDIADAMEAVAAGDYAYRVEASATDELGELVRSFNRMATDLEGSRHAVLQSATELSAANATLEARRRELETMLETIPNGVATLSPGCSIMLSNRALSEMMDPGGQKPFLGQTIAEVFPAEVVEVLERLIRRSHRMGSASSEIEMNRPGNGYVGAETLHLLATIALLETAGRAMAPMADRAEREHAGYVLVLENATELLRAQRQSAWKEVARRVAHEIKNPLTPIALSAEQIRRHIDRLAANLDRHSIESPSAGVIRRCSEVISSSVESMRSLVDQFSSLAEFPTAKPRPADLNTIVENALALFAGRMAEVRVRRDMDPHLPLVLADPESLKRALGNLIDNAAEAMSTSLMRDLQISTSLLPSGLVELVVADSGTGLTDEMRERLFLPYFSTKERGTGLGLSIAAKIIGEHGGTIRAEKNLPAGARFIVELRPAPAADSEPSPAMSTVISA